MPAARPRSEHTKAWKAARDEAFDQGRWWMPTNFAPKASRHWRPHGKA